MTEFLIKLGIIKTGIGFALDGIGILLFLVVGGFYLIGYLLYLITSPFRSKK